MIERNGRVAIYQQIASELRHGIRSGQWRPGSRLPSATELMAEHQVARLTARKAVKTLADEGLVDLVPGRGAFVTEQAA